MVTTRMPRIFWFPELLHPGQGKAIHPEKEMVGRLLSFWDSIFSGAMLNFQGVLKK